MLDAVLFDFDGTLVDSETLHYLCWDRILSPLGVKYTETEFCRVYSGRPTLESAADLVRLHGLDGSPAALAEQKNRLFVEVAQSEWPVLMPHARETLEKVKIRGLRCALVTGSTRQEALPVLAHYDLTDYFSVVVTKDDVTRPKPMPEPYLRALELLGVTAQRAVAVEDTETGLKAAHGAGIKTYVVPNAHTLHHDFRVAHDRCESLQALCHKLGL